VDLLSRHSRAPASSLDCAHTREDTDAVARPELPWVSPNAGRVAPRAPTMRAWAERTQRGNRRPSRVAVRTLIGAELACRRGERFRRRAIAPRPHRGAIAFHERDRQPADWAGPLLRRRCERSAAAAWRPGGRQCRSRRLRAVPYRSGNSCFRFRRWLLPSTETMRPADDVDAGAFAAKQPAVRSDIEHRLDRLASSMASSTSSDLASIGDVRHLLHIDALTASARSDQHLLDQGADQIALLR
jgi:hypothetical protein